MISIVSIINPSVLLLLSLSANDADAKFNADIKRLDEVYEQLQILGADAAKSWAGMILTGLKFTPSMQNGPTSALSGGWRM